MQVDAGGGGADRGVWLSAAGVLLRGGGGD